MSGAKSLVAAAALAGASVVAFTPTASAAPAATYASLYNAGTGHCLAVPGSSTAIGANVIQWTCGTNTDQVWIYDSAYRLRNLNSDRCLAIPNSTTTSGIKAVQWTYSTGADQQWVR
ncbi:RICIN domain-containing protein [Streptomyces cyaneofuscatus]|uniref:RICIN domain-containing protein n=1 Tax=Streptomyces cyaneofuscatus TaxID=66883 RepID=UPI00364DB3B9